MENAQAKELQERKLEAKDEEALKSFLLEQPDETCFLQSNLAHSGLTFVKNAPYYGDYYALVDLEGTIYAVIAHYWNGILMPHAPQFAFIEQLWNKIAGLLHRPITGVIGEEKASRALLSALESCKFFSLASSPFATNAPEELLALDLAHLRLEEVSCRQRSHREQADLCSTLRLVEAKALKKQQLLSWIKKYHIEGLGRADNVDLEHQCSEFLERKIEEGTLWALEQRCAGQEEIWEPCSLVGINAMVEKSVQIGPVWTPPLKRNRGFARNAIFHLLKMQRALGVQRAALFTSKAAAKRAYEAVGFEKVGMYRLALLSNALASRSEGK